MLWEVSQDFGMERPIRNFEMLSDVCGSWNADKTVNLLVIKRTQLAPLLSPQAIPSISPVCSGYVQWEYKRGKWQKRWMELREHSLWLSKRDTVRLFVLSPSLGVDSINGVTVNFGSTGKGRDVLVRDEDARHEPTVFTELELVAVTEEDENFVLTVDFLDHGQTRVIRVDGRPFLEQLIRVPV